MAWIQDDIQELNIPMEIPKMEGKAEIVEFKKIAPTGSGVPGGQVIVDMTVKNIGNGEDMLKGVAILMDAGNNLIEEKVMFINGCAVGNTITGPMVFTIPTNYSQSNIKVLGVGFHEE